MRIRRSCARHNLAPGGTPPRAVSVAIGIAVGYGLSEFVRTYQQWPAVIPPDAVATAVLFSAGVGIFFGFYPARKAAGLDPIEALRFE